MENASKALIMAAGVLLGIMIISFGVYLYTMFGNFSKQQHEEITANQLSQFNGQFLKYEGKDDVTAQDIVTIANLARDNNEYYEVKPKDDFYVAVSFGSTKMEKPGVDMNAFMQNNSIDANRNLIYYHCKVEVNEKTGRVYKVIFSK